MDDDNDKKRVKTKGLSEQDILNRASLGLSKSRNFTNTDIEQKRVAGLRLYKGEPFPGDKKVEGRSSYVTSDTLDNTEWLLANMMAVVFWSLTMITGFMIASLFGAGPDLTAAFMGIPQQLWDLTTYGIGAYILGKSGVDIAKAVRK